jgi:hypothetical protein
MSAPRLRELRSKAAAGTRAHNRFLYLCDWCLESLLAIHINDLFVKFGVIPKVRPPARRKVSTLKGQRQRVCIFP